MSTVSALFVFGLACLFSAAANTLPSVPNLIHIPIINQTLCLQLTSTSDNRNLNRRLDYTYTSGIGAHKVHTTSHTWNEAWRICRNEGGHLAIINSYAESRVISQLLEEAGPHVTGHVHSHIGFHDLFQKNEWVTIFDQSLVEAGFTEWDVNEPSSLDNTERCGSVHKNGKLNDINCDSICGFICELPYIEP